MPDKRGMTTTNNEQKEHDMKTLTYITDDRRQVEDFAKMVAALQAEGVDFRIMENGTTKTIEIT